MVPNILVSQRRLLSTICTVANCTIYLKYNKLSKSVHIDVCEEREKSNLGGVIEGKLIIAENYLIIESHVKTLDSYYLSYRYIRT